jgi:hypothetical protein
MQLTLAERAEKIRDAFQKISPQTIQQNQQFFDEVWNFCGAVIDSQQDGGQLIPEPLM